MAPKGAPKDAAKGVVKPAPVAKSSVKPTAKPAVKPAARAVAPLPASKGKGGVAVAPSKVGKLPTAAGKGGANAVGLNGQVASDKSAGKLAGGKPAAAKAPPPPKRKGPIDLTTAKSVAAVAVTTPADASGYVVVNGRRVRMISTRGLPSPKRTKVAVEKEAEKPEPQISAIKTKMNKKELDEYRQLLLAKRRQLVGMLSGMEDEALRSNGGNLSTMPLHMADIGTDTFDQDFTLGMAETERALLDEIDAALKRIDNRTYGVCQLTGKPIPKTRLEAKPWAKHTVESAKLVERGYAPR